MSTKTEEEHEAGLSVIGSEDLPVTVSHLGVKTVEAAYKVFGKYSRWALFISLGLAAYIYSLDGSTTYTYLAWATSSFEHHSLIATIQVAQSIIIAVGKPIVAKIADVQSRGFAYLVVLVFYIVGYIVIASASNVQSIAGGLVVYAMGYTGLQLLTQVIIADITTLKWRGLVSSLISLPFLINGFVGANISAAVIEHSSWRWGYGMFAILVPATLSPLIIVLLWAEHKAKKLGIVDVHGETSLKKHSGSFFKSLTKLAEQLDLVGLVLIGTSVSLILLPLTLAPNARNGWRNPSMIAMEVVGVVLIPMFALWDLKFAKHPVVARRFCFNRTVVIAAIIGAFDFISFYISFAYLYSFIIVVKSWTLIDVNYFTMTQTVALTAFGIIAGVLLRYFHRAKWILVSGLAIRLVGAGLMIHSRGANASTSEIVWSQLLQGIGGGFAAVASQVSAQASVPHVDVAMVTAIVLLITEIGNAIGTAIAGAIWTGTMPKRLARHLPFLSQEERQTLYGSIVSVTQYPRGNPIREGVVQAYDDVMKIMTIAATAFAIIPLFSSLFMPDWHLGDAQNAVENVDLAEFSRQEVQKEKADCEDSG